MINYSVSFPRHPWIFSWMSDTQNCKLPSTWTCITNIGSIYPSISFRLHHFTQISQAFHLTWPACRAKPLQKRNAINWLPALPCVRLPAQTESATHLWSNTNMPRRNLHMKRITQPLFLPIIKGSLLGIAWLVDTFHQKNLQKFAGQFPEFLVGCHIIFISTHLKTHQTYPAQKLTGQRNISTIWRCIWCMSYWKMAIFLDFPPGVSINSPGNLLGEFHQGSTPPWVPSSIHSLDQRLPPLTSTKIGTNLEKTHKTMPCLQVC